MLKNSSGSLKGVFRTYFYDYRQLLLVTTLIALAIQSMFLASAIWRASNGQGDIVTSGMINVYLVTSIISTFIMMIAITSKEEMRARFAFPINKETYFIGTAVMIVYGALMLTAAGIVSAFVEVLFLRVAGAIMPSFIPLTRVDVNTYLHGFIANFMYLTLLSSAYYTFFMFVRKWPIPTLLFGVFLLIAVMNVNVNPIGSSVVTLTVEASNFMMPMIQVGLWSIVLYGLSYIPLKKMEVA